jgi:hypothetical protein
MMPHDERKFLVGLLVFLASAGGSMFLILYAATNRVAAPAAFALYFWICLAWALGSGTVWFVRTRRPALWARFVEAEAAFRPRHGLNVERTRKTAMGRWVPIFFATTVGVFLLLTAFSAGAFLYFCQR